jgi:hypothetical protein
MTKGNLKIRMKERGTMRAFLIAKGMNPKQPILEAGESQLLSWMAWCYGFGHHKLWRIKT